MSSYNMYESNTNLSETDSQTNGSRWLIEYANGSNRGHFHSIEERAQIILSQPHAIIALILAFLAISMNLLSALAILHQHGALSSHYRFIFSLLMSDILTGSSVILHYVNQIFHPTYPRGLGPIDTRMRSYCMLMFLRALKTTALNSSLLNLMGMAIDHFLAILRPLHYPTLMNKQRASIFIGAFWIIAIICGFSDIMTSWYPKYPKYRHKINYCEFAYLTKYQDEYTVFAIAALCFVTMIVSYIRILSKIRKRHQDLQQLRHETIHRNKKAVITTLLILGTFVLSWLPTCLFQVILIISVYVNREMVETWAPVLAKADYYLFDLLLINAICDPLIYATRMPEIRNGYKRICLRCRTRQKRGPVGGESTNTSLLLTSFKTSMKNPEFHPKKVAKTNSLLTKAAMDVADV